MTPFVNRTDYRIAPPAHDASAAALHEEHRPAHAGQCRRQRGQHGPVDRARSRTGELAAQHADLMAEHQKFDVQIDDLDQA